MTAAEKLALEQFAAWQDSGDWEAEQSAADAAGAEESADAADYGDTADAADYGDDELGEILAKMPAEQISAEEFWADMREYIAAIDRGEVQMIEQAEYEAMRDEFWRRHGYADHADACAALRAK